MSLLRRSRLAFHFGHGLRGRFVPSTRTNFNCRRWQSSVGQTLGSDRLRFPGAINSEFSSRMSFVRPAELPAIPTYRIMDSDGQIVDATHAPDVKDEEVVEWYINMLTVNVMDVVMMDAHRQGRISFYMVSAGEEGIAVGSASALSPDDVVYAQYRETGVFKQRGFTLDDFMNQLLANSHDNGRGRNMPVHYGGNKVKAHTISSPLATQIPQAAGAAYALKLRSLFRPDSDSDIADTTAPAPSIVACYFGEGAASEGDFHAALNLAATRACPCVFICRNNGYAISTPTPEQYRGDGIAARGVAYGIESIRVDGNDVFAIRAAMIQARRLAAGLRDDDHDDHDGPPGPLGVAAAQRPVLIEAMSYRVSHHSTSDDSFAYRARVEVEDWKRRDSPIVRLRKWMENKGIWDEEMEKQTRQDLRKQVLSAFKRAEKEKKPPLKAMFEDVYEHMTEEAVEQREELRDVLARYSGEYGVNDHEGGLEGLK